jgi:kynurenine formamidase
VPSRWTRRPEGSTWGDWGEDDQLGRLNLLTPARVRRGVAEVREGRTFCLSLPLDCPDAEIQAPTRLPPVLRPIKREDGYAANYRYSGRVPWATDVINDDCVMLHLQYSTQWDSLAHVGALFDADGDGEPEVRYYNGYRGGDHIDGDGEGSRNVALGIEKMAVSCVQARGVLVDLHAHFGRQQGSVGYDDLMRIMEEDRVEIEEGDIVVLHTGLAEILLNEREQLDRAGARALCTGLDGRDRRLLQWITDSGLVALIADNFAVEAVPAAPVPLGPMLPLHEHCLFKLGVNLGELFYLGELARWLRANRRSRFLLTAPPLRLPGAVGSPVTAVATV